MNTLETWTGKICWVREDSGNYHSVSDPHGPCSYRIERTGRRWELVRIRPRNKKIAKGETVGEPFPTLDKAAEAADQDYRREVDEWWLRMQVREGAARVVRTPGMIAKILDACARVTKVPGAAEALRSPEVHAKVEAEVEKLARGWVP